MDVCMALLLLIFLIIIETNPTSERRDFFHACNVAEKRCMFSYGKPAMVRRMSEGEALCELAHPMSKVVDVSSGLTLGFLRRFLRKNVFSGANVLVRYGKKTSKKGTDQCKHRIHYLQNSKLKSECATARDELDLVVMCLLDCNRIELERTNLTPKFMLKLPLKSKYKCRKLCQLKSVCDGFEWVRKKCTVEIRSPNEKFVIILVGNANQEHMRKKKIRKALVKLGVAT
ncbi:hypothetical protein HELRODRAFT_177350 [Helobdella robusta]|uniref:Apple domain-containing protein n=1 Tax=Helobdella robusta TaxID=6412 RepID=T1FBJ7_HELRO|nr:hypothetical protein HELRODRAFT_177350 [Helobdella robusta]ESN98112.1 hypothetical protein HELRODRAFT_177350 [Helobdella robusta]